MYFLAFIESVVHRVSRCTHSFLCNATFLRRQSTKQILPAAPSFQQQSLHPYSSSSMLLSSCAEPCSRLLAAVPAHQGTRRLLHHSFSSRTCASSSLLKNSKPPEIDRSLEPELLEKDLEEKFIKGWGPGGQSVNKTSNAVFLKHVPTGLFVKVHMHRMRQKNSVEARLLLREKLDNHINGPMSVSAQKARLLEKKSAKSKSKAKKMRDLKDQWKRSQGDTGTLGDGVTDERP